MDPASSSEPKHETVPTEGRAATPVIRSEVLLGGQKEILIEHSGEMYRLRLTRNGKLILQK